MVVIHFCLFSLTIHNLVLKSIWKGKGPRTVKAAPKKIKDGRFTLLDTQDFHISIGTKTTLFGASIDQYTERSETPIQIQLSEL